MSDIHLELLVIKRLFRNLGRGARGRPTPNNPDTKADSRNAKKLKQVTQSSSLATTGKLLTESIGADTSSQSFQAIPEQETNHPEGMELSDQDFEWMGGNNKATPVLGANGMIHFNVAYLLKYS
jgi:hypothetical protein